MIQTFDVPDVDASLFWVVYFSKIQVRLDLADLNGLRAYLTPDTTCAQQAKSIVVVDAVASERNLSVMRVGFSVFPQ